MLRFFHSMFTTAEQTGGNSESLLSSAIERAVEQTDPWLRAVSGYKRKLRPAVLRTIDYVAALVDGMAPPIPLEPAGYGGDPRLRAFFISGGDMGKVLANDRNLAAFRRQSQGSVPRINALLTMEKQERTVLGTELAGNLLLHDIPQRTVSFEEHHLFDPTGSERETRRQLNRRAFDHLLRLAQKRIARHKTERADLERCRAALQSKLSLRQRRGWGDTDSSATNIPALACLQEQLGRIEGQLKGLGREDRTLEAYLEIVRDVLNRPEEHLWAKKETLIIDRMGIKRSAAGGDAAEVTLDLVQNAEGRSLVVSLVSLSEETMR